MIKLIQFELTKIMKSFYFKMMMLGLLVLLLIFYAVVYLYSQSVFEREVANDRAIVTQLENTKVAHVGIWNEHAKTRLEGFETGNWTEVLDGYIEVYKEFVEHERAFPISGQLFKFESVYSELQLIQERNIEPVLPVPRPGHAFGFGSVEDEEEYHRENKKYASTSLYFSYHGSG